MRVVGVVSEASLVRPFETMLRLGGIENFSVVHDEEGITRALSPCDVDIVITAKQMAKLVTEAATSLGTEVRTRSKFALMTIAQTAEIVKLAAELDLDGIVDVYQEPRVVHQHLYNMVFMSPDWSSIPPAATSPDILFLATRDALDRSVISLVALGLTDKQIANEIGLATQTVRNRLSKVMIDAGLTNRTQVAHMWLREQSLLVRNANSESVTRETR